VPLRHVKLVAPVVIATISLIGCATERVKMTVDSTRIEQVSDRLLFGTMVSESAPMHQLEVLVFEVSSDVDIRPIFENRQIQVRCEVDGKGDSSGYGPFNGNVNLSTPWKNVKAARMGAPLRTDGRSAYTVYAFANLAATNLVDGRFVDTPLESMNFSKLSCFISGVTKAPVFFPRSNEFILTHAKFLNLLAEYRGRSGAA
jgi:hypothetical protein